MSQVVVVGAGAAGLMAAIAAGENGAAVRILDSQKKIGAKILVAGGGRCNVTNEFVAPSRFHGEGVGPFLARIFRSFSPEATHRFFDRIGVPLKLEETGKFFPVSDSSRTVLNALLDAAKNAGVQFSLEAPVLGLKRENDGFLVETPHETIAASAVILCTGGLALPKSGSDGRGYAFATQWGHSLIPTTPALTPLLSETAPHAALSGLTLPVRIWLQNGGPIAGYDGSFLFTHWGYSGPAALNLSRHVVRERPKHPGAAVFVRLLPEVSPGSESQWWHEFQGQNAKKTLANALGTFFPQRLAENLANRAGVGTQAVVGKLHNAQVTALKREIFAAPLPVSQVAGYTKAEATAGGIALAEIEPATMMSRLAPGLFLAGEICDVDGWLGGYNFQWAWSSGVVAGRAAARWAKKLGA